MVHRNPPAHCYRDAAVVVVFVIVVGGVVVVVVIVVVVVVVGRVVAVVVVVLLVHRKYSYVGHRHTTINGTRHGSYASWVEYVADSSSFAKNKWV